MAIQTPGCCDSEWQLLYKILQSLPDISGGGGASITVQDEGVNLTTSLSQINFVGAGVTATAVGDDVTVTIPAGAAGVLQSGVQVIGIGVVFVAVVFPVAFASAPNVVTNIGHPTGEANILADVLTDTVTTLGFTARFTGATGSVNYTLYWMAHI